ncbi:diguanylate cyclase domain-containing protein [Neobacillus vireti]|uniref:diguanylate cyclase domain-containing protein n=1 Tax=Neobacillus vireti TaxID=220686 RepID=UPI002FFF6B85
MNLKLRTYVAVLFAVGIFGITAILSMMIGTQSSQKVEEQIGNTLSATAYNMADKLDHFMWSRAGEINVISQLKDIQNPADAQQVQILLNKLQESIPAFSWVGVTDVNGKVLAATNGILTGGDISKRPVYQEGIKGSFVGDVHDAVLLAKLLPNPSGEPLQFVDISRPIVTEDGKLTGVIAAHLSWEWSREVEKEILKPLKEKVDGAEIFVVSQKDQLVLLGPSANIGKRLNLESLKLAKKGQNNWRVETWPNGQKYLTGYAFGDGYQNYPGLGWSILVRVPEKTAFAPVHDLQKSILLIGVVLSIIFALLGWFASALITKPLQQISHSANRLRAGEKVEIPHYKGIKDIEMLSLSLRDLVESLVRTVSDLGKMENLAHHDTLTGLMNRIALDQFLEGAVETAKQMGNRLTFLYLDLDGFKQVNDTLGHQVGDRLLQETAKRLKNCVRSNEGVFRLGGDEFLVILFTTFDNSVQEATMVAEKIINSLNQPFDLHDQKIKVGCSIGAAVWDDQQVPSSEIIRSADEALYVSKRTGKNKVTFS